jgi:hypothetical protein
VKEPAQRKRYYRWLYQKSHVKRWDAQLFTSSHHQPPGAWIDEWNRTHSPDPISYPLKTGGYVYTMKARDAFLACAPGYGPNDLWAPADREEAGELEGVCAFETPSALWSWAQEPSEGDDAADDFVEFEGTYVCPCPEGVVANEVVPLGGRLSRKEFRERHHL